MAEVVNKMVTLVCRFANGRYGKKELMQHGIAGVQATLRFKTHVCVVTSTYAKELEKHPQWGKEFGIQGQYKFTIPGEPVRVVKAGDEFASNEGRDKAMAKLEDENAKLKERLEKLEAAGKDAPKK